MTVGDTTWTVKQFASATHVTPTAASRKAGAFARRLRTLASALSGLDPTARPCDLAEELLAVLRTGGQLAAADEETLRTFVRQVCQEEASRPSRPGDGS